MKTIWKYELHTQDLQTVAMPTGARILSAQLQGGVPCLWALVDSERPVEPRRIRILGTGHPAEDHGLQYIGTVVMAHFGLVWHIFEVVEALT